MVEVDCVVSAGNELGESPIWDDRERALYWADIRGPALHRFDPASGATQAWPLPDCIGSFAVREGGGMLLALRGGLYAFDPASGALAKLGHPEADRTGDRYAMNRYNDGKCDRRGRFWVGTMSDRSPREAVGALYRVDADLASHRILDGVAVPNSLAWSPDGRVMYFADTSDGRLRAYAYDAQVGRLGPMRVLAEASTAPGRPDGATVDEAGCLWSACYGGGALARFTPDGRLDRVVSLPVSQVTSCAFGGPRLDTLYVTTATQRLTPEQRAREPLAGGLFALSPGVRGLPEPRFAG